MKIYIDFKTKVARVVTESISDAGWCGFNFVKNNLDLIKAGWHLYFYPDEEKVDSRYRVSSVLIAIGPNTLAETIRTGQPKSCCHDCCCHK